jgi:hypothetical protein
MALHRPRRAGAEWLHRTFNGRLRDECLIEHLFDNLAEARGINEAWRIDYNTKRPHTSLNELTPKEFAARPTRGITRTDSPSERGHAGEHVTLHKLHDSRLSGIHIAPKATLQQYAVLRMGQDCRSIDATCSAIIGESLFDAPQQGSLA